MEKILIEGQNAGGQCLRTSLSLSAITNKPFKIINIRGKRENTGLRPQHLTAVNAIAQVCSAEVKGNELYSTSLEFIPSKIIPNHYKFDIGTAGSTTLVLQTILPALITANEKSIIEITGGTANPQAPPALDIKEVFLWYLKKLNININLDIEREGFYPKGNGKIKIIINPCKKINELNIINRDETSKKINVTAVCSKDLNDKQICKRLIDSFMIKSFSDYKINSKEIYTNTSSPGCYIHANCECDNSKIGMTVLGEKGRKSEDIGKECAVKLLNEIKSNASIDYFTADQLLIYLALKGSGSIKVSHVTDHIKTNIDTIEKFLDIKFKIENNVISCNK